MYNYRAYPTLAVAVAAAAFKAAYAPKPTPRVYRRGVLSPAYAPPLFFIAGYKPPKRG